MCLKVDPMGLLTETINKHYKGKKPVQEDWKSSLSTGLAILGAAGVAALGIYGIYKKIKEDERIRKLLESDPAGAKYLVQLDKIKSMMYDVETNLSNVMTAASQVQSKVDKEDWFEWFSEKPKLIKLRSQQRKLEEAYDKLTDQMYEIEEKIDRRVAVLSKLSK